MLCCITSVRRRLRMACWRWGIQRGTGRRWVSFLVSKDTLPFRFLGEDCVMLQHSPPFSLLCFIIHSLLPCPIYSSSSSFAYFSPSLSAPLAPPQHPRKLSSVVLRLLIFLCGTSRLRGRSRSEFDSVSSLLRTSASPLTLFFRNSTSRRYTTSPRDLASDPLPAAVIYTCA